jgi:hypothetical protein
MITLFYICVTGGRESEHFMVLNNIDSLKTVSQSSEPEAARAAAAQMLRRPVAATVARVKPPWGELFAVFMEKSEVMKQTHLPSLPS